MRLRTIVVVFLLFLIIPTSTLASHRNNRVDTSDLDDDPVEEIPIPVLFGVEYDNIIPDFGDPRGGGTREHEGQDMHAPEGTPIVSPTEAVVIRTGTGVSAGKYVYTANPGGEIFRYMHLEYIADLNRGDELDVGDFIGTVGDTGNAQKGAYHLHLEIRDDGNDATDPHPRLTDAFTLKEKISFLSGIFRDIKDDDEYAEFLVTTFREDFVAALKAGYKMPKVVEEVLEDEGVTGTIKAQERLREVLAQIPKLLALKLQEGDQGAAVQLLQLYLMYSSQGPERDALSRAGATGYYGPITAGALSAYQEQIDVMVTGVYDDATREALL